MVMVMYHFAKIGNDGLIKWEKYFGGRDYDFGSSIKKTNDGRFVIAASTYSEDGNVTNAHRRLY